ncbi:CBS domain-containing protein [Halobaculum sp. MBLA0143]|uniref:CBS domain-containing protein n=1 Tax=Halobaculum sp. MBLA0143 TaxID=3079933 RepID=UPI003523CACB
MRGIRVGRVAGIPIQLNWTFLVILPVFAWLIGQQVGRLIDPLNGLLGLGIAPGTLTGGLLPLALGAGAAVGLFGSVLLHEFGHSFAALRYGYGIESITLWLFGGVAQFEDNPDDWRAEFVIALAGPAVSVGLGVAFGAVASTVSLPETVAFVVGYLALMNVVLAVFNMLPGFPMDGGRVLRALLASTYSYPKATKIAADVGKVFAFLMGFFGILSQDWLLVGLALFVYVAASGEAQQTALQAALEDVTVGDIMTPASEVKTVAPRTSVAELLSRMVQERHTGYPVVENDRLVGMVTLEDAQSVREVEQDAYPVGDVMATEIASVGPRTEAIQALRAMQDDGVGRLIVVDDDGDLVGLISRTDLMDAFDIISRGGRVGGPGRYRDRGETSYPGSS